MTDVMTGRSAAFDDGPRDLPSDADLRKAQDFLLRRWVVIGSTLAIVLLLAATALDVVPPRFTARTDVLLEPQRQKSIGPDDAIHLVNLDTADVESALVVLKASTVLDRVVAREGLAADPDYGGRAPATPTEAASKARAALLQASRVERIGKSDALSVAVTSRSPDKAARLSNALADAFVDDQRAARLEASRRAATFFAERLGPLGDHLRRSEDALEQFRREHDLIARTTSVQSGGSLATINEQQLGELNSRLATARAATAEASARYDQARTIQGRGGSIETIPDVVGSPLIGQLRQQQAEVARKEGDLAAHYSDGYPALVNARAERREIERSIAREIARVFAKLKGAYDIATAEEDRLREAVAQLTGAAGLDSDLGPRLRELERVRLVDQTLFETYLTKAKATEQQAGFDDDSVRVISRADPQFLQMFPQPLLVLGLMTVFGLGFGVAIGVALDRLDPGFLSPRDMEAALGMPVLAAVPWLRARELMREGKAIDPTRYLAHHPRSPYAEAVHAIRAGVRQPRGGAAKVVLVTSSLQGEGKSAIAFSLGLSAARAGQRVLLLDADLRQPALSRSFGLEHRLGLVDMLSGLVGTAETTVPLGAGLYVMPSGRKTAVPPDLFASNRMAHYLGHLRRHYDLVVIDAAPAGAVVDAKVLGEISDRIVFVVGWRATAREVVARNIRALGHPAKLAGVVLNKIDARKMPRHGRDAYGVAPLAMQGEA